MLYFYRYWNVNTVSFASTALDTDPAAVGSGQEPGPGNLGRHAHEPADARPASARRLHGLRRMRGTLLRVMIVCAAAALSGLTWGFTLVSVETGQREALTHAVGDVSMVAGTLTWELARQLALIDQSIVGLAAEWRTDPAHFDADAWVRRSSLLGDAALQLSIVDARGVVVSSTRKGAVGVNLSESEDFRAHRDGREAGLFVGSGIHAGAADSWDINVSRRIDGAEGGFAGVIVIGYVPSGLSDLLRTVNLDTNGTVMLVGPGGGVSALVSRSGIVPGGNVAASRMFAHLSRDRQGVWTGPSATDGVRRIHAFRRLAGHDLTVVAGADANEAMHGFSDWAVNARLFAGGISILSVLMAALLIGEINAARGREERLAEDRAAIENAYAALKAAKANAEAKTGQLEATITGMSDGVMMLDADLRIVQWNERFAQLAGIPAELLRVGTSAEDLLRAQASHGEFGPVDVEAEVERRLAALHETRGVRVAERQRPNGRTFELRRSALPAGGFVTLYTDITGRKQVEEAQLSARRLAEEAARQKSRFVAIVSHEIRTPLNALVNSLALLDHGGMSPSQQRLSETARQAGFALLDLVNDVLELSELETGRPALRPSAFELRPVLEGVQDMFRPQAEARGLTMTVDIAADLPSRVHADGGRIRQVIMNFVSNATKFSRAGHITISASAVTDPQARGALKLSVQDQGPRISDAEAAHLFQPFSRLENARASGVIGTGLGLAICERLTRLMDGSIGVSPAPGDGNDFWVTLPLVPAAAAVAVARVPANPRTRRASVLVVEDIPANHFVTATLLRREGHRVDVAESGADAVARVSRHAYDLVFMDLIMPGMNGYEAARRIRGLSGPESQVPIVALTATVAPEDRARCIEAGLDDMIGKPVRPANLNEVVARAVWRAGHARPMGSGVDDVARPVETMPVLDRDRVIELQQRLPAAKLVTLVEECLADMRVRLTPLQQALAAGQPEAIEESAHALAGMAATYGLVAFESRMRRLMSASRRHDLRAATQAGEELDIELCRAAAAIRQEMDGRLIP